MSAFRDFLLDEIQKRNMSVSGFAHWLGVTHTTINRLLDSRVETDPSAKTLAVMSEKLEVPIEALFSMAYPNIENARFSDDPDALALAKRISKLSAKQREFIVSAIKGMLIDQRDEE